MDTYIVANFREYETMVKLVQPKIKRNDFHLMMATTTIKLVQPKIKRNDFHLMMATTTKNHTWYVFCPSYMYLQACVCSFTVDPSGLDDTQ